MVVVFSRNESYMAWVKKKNGLIIPIFILLLTLNNFICKKQMLKLNIKELHTKNCKYFKP